MNDQAIEQEIQAKGLSAPRTTLAEFNANIVDTEIVTHVAKSGQVLRWAVLTAKNGFAVAGKPSVAVSPEDDNAELGTKIAIDNARDELWPLMGYALKERLSASAAEYVAVVADGLETVTFTQFVQYGRDNGGNIVNGMPWSFSFRGHPVSHENDRRYIIGNGTSNGLNFTPDDLLVINPDGSLATIKADPVLL